MSNMETLLAEMVGEKTFQGWRTGTPRRLGQAIAVARTSSFIRTVTVGPGIAPGLLTPTRESRALAGSQLALPTAGGEFRPALKTCAGRMPTQQW
jgi:hypothetical protein